MKKCRNCKSSKLKKLFSLGKISFTGKFPKNKKCEYFRANLENKEDALEVSEGMDYVFMCAANTSGAAVIDKEPLVHLTPNLIMNARILEAAYFNSVKKLCFISSNTVYPLIEKLNFQGAHWRRDIGK